MIKNMTVLLPHLEKSDDSTRVGCRPALNGCFITVSDRCRQHPAAVWARCRGALSKPTKRDSETGIHRRAVFSQERQLSHLCLYGNLQVSTAGVPPVSDISSVRCHQKMHRRREEAIYNQIPQLGTETLVVIHHMFQGSGSVPDHQDRCRVSQSSATCGTCEQAE